VSHEYYHVGVAPNEVGGRRLTIHALVERLDLNQADLERAFAGDKRYLYFHGPFTAEQVQPLRRLPGIHLESEYRRFYPAGGLARPVIGAIAPDGDRGISGLELSLDSILSGEPGEAVVLKDRAGRIYESPSRVVREPLAGLDVTLTLDAELQDIAEQGLNDAIRDMRADGGDVVFLDPRSGELLALASHQADAADPAAFRPSTLTDPFEPGSTAKLFTAAALLTHRLVDSNDRVFAEHGEWNMVIPARGKPLVRKIRDVHASPGSLTLAQAIQVSSNIAMAKFSLRLAPESQYEMLRDFGFGSPSGAEFPAETRGRLNRPDRWRAQISGPSLAMGYEFGVTPVQLAAAYGAIANDGILLTPALVQSIRDPEGGLLYRHRPEPVRRVVSPEVAATLRGYLRGAVSEGGTGERAQLVNYTLLGKTGTALRFEGGRYVPGEYTASFAALFPAEDPQLVVIVKIENPKAIYGGLTAAPVTRRMLDQALAARRVAIDRSRLVGREQVDSTAPPAEAPAGEEPERDSAGQVVVVPWPPAPVAAMPPVRVLVPDVRGFNVRKAALALHRRGFRVVLRGQGRVVRTEPAGADSAQRGGAVTVWASDE
jgi:cell division protein FtsI (penicillin-binding protein 3)